MSKQVLENTTMTIKLTAEGESYEQIMGKLFNQLRKQVYKQLNKSIIQMDTNAVYIESEEKSTTTEKFLFFFMPREKTNLTITANIEVVVKYIDL